MCHFMKKILIIGSDKISMFALPWNPSLLCVGVDYRNIRQLTSNSKPYIVPLIICKKSGNQKVKYIKNILIKHEDLRKDKLTMYVTRWINILCHRINHNENV